MQFQYTAKATTGTLSSGMIDAVSPSEARQQLRQRGLFALSLNTGEAPARSATVSTPRFRKSKVKKTDLLMLTTQLSIMCRSGIDLAEALSNVAEQCNHPGLKLALDELYRDVADGQSVSAALDKQSHIFGNAYVASVAAGEASGRISEVLSRLAELLKHEIRLRGTVTAVLSYPIVLVSVASVVIAALVFFVLPQFATVFEDLEAPAPPLTRFLLDGAQMLRENIFYVLGASGLFVVGLVQLWRTEKGRWHRDRLLLNGFLIKNATRAILTGRTFRLLATMLQSGIPLLEAIQLCRTSVKNVHFRKLFDVLEDDVLNGRGISHALKATKFMPLGATQMIVTAERTGKLGEIMQTVGEYYEDEGERQIRDLAKFLEPAIIVIMGVVVAVVVMSVMLPLLDFSTLSS